VAGLPQQALDHPLGGPRLVVGGPGGYGRAKMGRIPDARGAGPDLVSLDGMTDQRLASTPAHSRGSF
jgi:hypothetical protein